MLPIHTVKLQGSDSADSQSGEEMAYPPSRLNGQSGARRANDKLASSLQSRLLGGRGVTSFTIQTQTPYESTNELKEGQKASNGEATTKARPTTSPSRWNTWEFYFYALVFAIAVPWMCWVPISLSSGESQIQLVALCSRNANRINSHQNLTSIIPDSHHISHLAGCLVE
jgi:hypothetical protein